MIINNNMINKELINLKIIIIIDEIYKNNDEI